MKNKLIYFLGLLLAISCGQPKPRKPVAHTGNIDLSRSVEYNKKLSELQNRDFHTYIRHDSTHTYINSHRGFWYTYLNKVEKESPRPQKGQTVEFVYSVKRMDGTDIYTEEELGKKTYVVDKEDFMKGIQEGIKLMKVNERVRFLLPSQQAYGFTGDTNKIGVNTPLVVEVELLSIESD